MNLARPLTREEIRKVVEFGFDHKKKIGEDLSQDAPLFMSRQKKRPCRQQARGVFMEAFNKCKVRGDVSSHSMRKSFGLELLRVT